MKTISSVNTGPDSSEDGLKHNDNRQRSDEYQRVAPYYEKILGKFLYPLRKDVRTFIHYHNHRKIIDICCGTGKQLEMLVEPDITLFGIDLSPTMLNEATDRGNINFIQKDATEIDFKEESFDAVLLSFALHEKSRLDREIILRKSWNLVREGGHLIIADYCRIPSTFLGTVIGRMFIPLLERAAGKKHYSHYRSWMKSGALDDHIHELSERKEIISYHFGRSVLLCGVFKMSQASKIFQSVNKVTLG